MDESVFISTPDHVALEFELAGPGSRFSAYLLDFLFSILIMIAVVLILFLSGAAGLRTFFHLLRGESSWITAWGTALLILILFVIHWGYYVFFEGLWHGATPGKKSLGIRVIRQDGLPIGFREAALRNLVRVADMLPPPCYILGGLVAHFDRHGRRLGDMVAGTLVVMEKFELASRSSTGAAWAARIEKGGSRQALTLPRGTVTAQQISLIEQFLARRHQLTPERRDLLVWQIAEPLLPFLAEDAQTLAQSPERTERCERILLQIVEMAQASQTKPRAVAGKTGVSPSLF
jgi:uncharacterized RDD family membrane protein YckC